MTSLDALRRVEQMCTRFEQSSPQQREDLAQFLSGTDGEERVILLSELIPLDAELRLDAGEPPRDQVYEKLWQSVGGKPDGIVGSRVFEHQASQQVVPPAWQPLPPPSSPADPQLPQSARYLFRRPIGSGGIGDIWRVWDTRGQRTLAIKVLRPRLRGDPAAQRRLRREALLTGSLQHPGIPPVYDHGQLDDGTHFFSMKLVDGDTLATLLSRGDRGENHFGERLGVFEQVAQALAYAHTEGVVHRDLKAQNVMVGRFGEAQLMDWGLAKRVDDAAPDSPRPPAETPSGSSAEPLRDAVVDRDQPQEAAASDVFTARQDTDGAKIFSDSPILADAETPALADAQTPAADNMTQAGEVVGTPNCMAPEQARGEIDRVDRRTDVFGLGAMLYQILTGGSVYEGDTLDDVLAKSIRGDLERAYRELDRFAGRNELVAGQEKLVELCRRCLRRDPADRLADAEQVAAAVADYRTGLERQVRLGEIELARSETRHQEQRKRQRVVLASAVGLTTVALLGTLGIGWQWNRATRLATAEAHARREAQVEAETVAKVNNFLITLLESPLPENRGYDVTLREVIDASLPGLDEPFTDRPRVEGQIRRTIGETYRWLGDADESERQFRAALRAFRRETPPDEAEIVETTDRLAGVLRSRGAPEDLTEALSLRESAMRRRAKTLGESHPDTIVAMNNLGVVLLDLGQPDRAADLYERAIRLAEAARATGLADSFMMTLNLANARQQQGDLAAAERGYRAVIDRNANDPNEPARMNAETLLGEMIAGQGRYDEAIGHLRNALAARDDHYGPEHPLTLSSMRKLSRTFNDAHRWDEALQLLRQTLRRHEQTFHPGSGTVFGVRRELAAALTGLGRTEEAETFRRATIEILREHRGPEHRYTRQASAELAAHRGSR